MRHLRKAATFAAACVAGLAVSTTAQADEPLLGFLYTTDLLPKGGMEVEQWFTWKHKKAGGIFDLVEGQSEFSYGVSESLQVSGYLIYDWTQAYHNAPDGTTTPPEQYSAYFPNPDSHYNAFLFQGVAGEVLWRVASPYTDPVGVALYFEPIIGSHFREIEVKGIFQKNFLDDRLIVVGNATWAPEIRPVPGDPYADPTSEAYRPNTNVETDINFGVGASYRFAPNWSAGWEFQNEREINSWNIFNHSQWMGNGFYTGPTVHYANKHFFATLTWWQQLPWAKNYMDPTMIVNGYDDDVDFEHTRVRFKVGWYF
jgi:hypothetical protein